MDISLSAVDRIVALVGFLLTLWQLYKTRTAAIAAKDAADAAVSAVRNLEAVTKMQDISSRTRDLLRLLREGVSFKPAAEAAFELRDTVARYRDPNNQVIVSVQEWGQAVLDVKAVHDKLEGLAMIPRTRKEDREPLVHEVARLHTFFTTLAAQA
jgi:hypothetical protein